MRLTERDERRFWSKVALPAGQGCMLWLGKPDPDGYGWFYLNGRNERAHRVSYVLAYGEIPDGLVVDHVKAKGCTNRHCMAPEHLEAVTHAENTLRGESFAAVNARKTHCPQGHPYNTVTYPSGRRRCHACETRREREAYKKRAVDGALVIQHHLGPVAGIVSVLPVINKES